MKECLTGGPKYKQIHINNLFGGMVSSPTFIFPILSPRFPSGSFLDINICSVRKVHTHPPFKAAGKTLPHISK